MLKINLYSQALFITALVSTMNKEQQKGIKLLSIAAIIFMILSMIHADETVNGEESRNKNPNSNQISSNSNLYHPKIKRAWNQLQNGGWGKRSFEENEDDESADLLNRRLMKLYAEQLLGNVQNDEEIDNYDNAIDKRAWSQFNGGWGKRDWNQLRGK